MDDCKEDAGNANLRIGGGRDAIRVNRVPGVWHSRGYLPHFESAEATQHVTFHLEDSLPQRVLARLEAELKNLPSEKRNVELRKRVEAWIDAGHGCCILRQPSVAEMVQSSLLHFDTQRYRLMAWVVMPNHVHVLFQPMNGWAIAKIVASWKKFTARKICEERRIGSKEAGAPVWHREYWDRYIRDERHHLQAMEYIHANPVKAGLASEIGSWRWSSAFQEDANREIGVPGRAGSV